ncbi:MAG: YbjQ family protein [Gammaproteobacteria bacterium]|nr:YbjQ family protein [Gammaproteobacteria bacterium]
MLISNLELIHGNRVIEHLGLVQGSTVRSKHAGRDLLASLKNVFGGELTAYTELLQESREQAMQRMILQAESLGANAILNVRFSTSSVTQGAAEIYVYGTAVIME